MQLSLHFSPMLAATSGLEALIFILIAGASAIFNWWRKRNEDSDWSQAEKPRPDSPQRTFTSPLKPAAPPTRKSDWEEELRRMLEGAGVPQSPPPIIREHKPEPPIQSVPERATMALPKVFEEVKTYKGHCQNCGGHIEFPSNMTGDTIECPHCYQQTALEPIQESRLEKVMHRTERNVLSESATVYERASHLQESVAAQMAEISRQPVPSITSINVDHFKKRSAEIDQVVALLRRPQTARQVILASVILGPPKAFETP